jgi:hypothetical protein
MNPVSAPQPATGFWGLFADVLDTHFQVTNVREYLPGTNVTFLSYFAVRVFRRRGPLGHCWALRFGSTSRSSRCP